MSSNSTSLLRLMKKWFEFLKRSRDGRLFFLDLDDGVGQRSGWIPHVLSLDRWLECGLAPALADTYIGAFDTIGILTHICHLMPCCCDVRRWCIGDYAALDSLERWDTAHIHLASTFGMCTGRRNALARPLPVVLCTKAPAKRNSPLSQCGICLPTVQTTHLPF